MHLEDQNTSGPDKLPLARLENRRGHPRSGSDKHPLEAPFKVLIRISAFSIGTRFANQNYGMMHYGAISRPNFCGLDPGILLEIRRYGEVREWDYPFSGDGELLPHGKDHVGLSDTPPFDEGWDGGHVSGISFFRPAINPGENCVDLALRQTRIVLARA